MQLFYVSCCMLHFGDLQIWDTEIFILPHTVDVLTNKYTKKLALQMIRNVFTIIMHKL